MNARNRIGIASAAVLALAAGGLVASVRAQDRPEAPADEPAALVKQLGDADFAAREKAYARLREAGASARAALEEGAKSEDAQVRWSSKRLLRLLDGERPGLRRRTLVFENDVDRGPTTLEDETFRKSMEDLRRRLEEMEREFQDFEIRVPPPFRFHALPGGSGATSESHVVIEKDGERTELRQSADGKVKVVLGKKGADGVVKEETFEAENMDALAKAHPEVHAKVKDLVGDRVQVRIGGGFVPMGGGAWFRPEPKPALGVTVSEVPPVLRTQLSLESEEGVVVEEVMPGTPASRMELRRHDVILSVNGIPVSTAAELRSAVGAVKEGGALTLRILRGGKVTEVAGSR